MFISSSQNCSRLRFSRHSDKLETNPSISKSDRDGIGRSRLVRDLLVRSLLDPSAWRALSVVSARARTIEIRSYEAIISLRHRARIIAISLIASRSLRFGQRVFGMDAVA